jgi:hypothetical protein
MRFTKPTKEELNSIDLSHLQEAIKDSYHAEFMTFKAGLEHYKLLAWVSMQFKKGKIVEIGTSEGAGALALSYGGRPVETYDIVKIVHPYVEKVVKCFIDGDSLEAASKAKVVFVDAPHNGDFEWNFLESLMKTDFKGMIIFDDIHLNEPMREFWDKVKKLGIDTEDWTDVGHWSGTGVVFI